MTYLSGEIGDELDMQLDPRDPRHNAPPPIANCIFCGSGKLSREHLYPEWLKKLLSRDDLTHSVETK